MDAFKNRYFPPESLKEVYTTLGQTYSLDKIGTSVDQRPIYALTIGQGERRVLAWSQMHGNESTSTKALIDLIGYLETSPHGKDILSRLTLKVILQLNPDGAHAYTRVNANGVDLNRDAVAQTQPETQALMALFKTFKPDFCFNLHEQRTIFSVGEPPVPATLSFLAPAADADRTITKARKIAMQIIANIYAEHKHASEWGIGRYDDQFNFNCTGDYFTARGVPTVLFEGGHYPGDYLRLHTRELYFKSLKIALRSIITSDFNQYTTHDYLVIPENESRLRDIEIQNVTIVNKLNITNSRLFVQYKEQLIDGEIAFIPEIVDKTMNLKGLRQIKLTKSQQKIAFAIDDSADDILKQLKLLTII